EVQVRFDFLALSPGEESSKSHVPSSKAQVASPKAGGAARSPENGLAKWGIVDEVEVGGEKPSEDSGVAAQQRSASATLASAYIPFNYISDSRLRIEIYRKIAQATGPAFLQSLERELRDRFGPLPSALDLLMQVAELKFLAAERGVTAVEVKEDKLMLTRNNDYIMVGSKFPRLIRKQATARLREIRKLLLAL